MFLKTVYRHNRAFFAAMIVFIIAQIFINYKHGLVISPFYHYGMYSEVFKVKESYEVLEVIQNNKLLRGQDFSPQQWDKIMLPIQYYSNIKKSNELFETDIKRLTGKLHITTDEKYFLQNCDYGQFEQWYKRYLSSVTKQATNSLSIQQRTYHYSNTSFTPADSTTPLAALCH